MQSRSEEVAQLECLRDELNRHGLNARLVTRRNRPHLKVANQAMPELNERVLCRPGEDHGLCFWWPWGQPIGPVDDLDAVVGKIAAVLRPVEGQL